MQYGSWGRTKNDLSCSVISMLPKTCPGNRFGIFDKMKEDEQWSNMLHAGRNAKV